MKTFIKIFSLVLFSVFAISAKAQSNTAIDQGYWWWKDVQKIANRNLANYPHLSVTSLDYPAGIISKQVQTVRHPSLLKTGNMKSTGYPTWTISKDVQKIAARQR